MRIVINETTALGQKTGIGHYATQLLRCLRELAPQEQIDSYPFGWARRFHETCARGRSAAEPETSGGGQPAWKRTLLLGLRQASQALTGWHFRRACSGRYDLYHEPNYIPLSSDLPTVATVADLSVLLYPQWHPADRVAYFERHFENGLKRCEQVLAISEFSRQEIIRTLGIPARKVTRTYMGIRPGLRPLPEAWVRRVLGQVGLPQRYLLYLGTIEPRKNVLLLLRAYCALPLDLRERWPLVLVGRWGWNTSDTADFYHSHARHQGVRHLGYVPEEHLAAVYNGARALVYPSFYEGFGLPPLEMMACGGAVLAARVGALVETVGRQAALVEPEDFDAWRNALAHVLTDDDWVQGLRRGAVSLARPFTWDRCAAETLRVYRAVCGVPEPQFRRQAG